MDFAIISRSHGAKKRNAFSIIMKGSLNYLPLPQKFVCLPAITKSANTLWFAQMVHEKLIGPTIGNPYLTMVHAIPFYKEIAAKGDCVDVVKVVLKRWLPNLLRIGAFVLLDHIFSFYNIFDDLQSDMYTYGVREGDLDVFKYVTTRSRVKLFINRIPQPDAFFRSEKEKPAEKFEIIKQMYNEPGHCSIVAAQLLNQMLEIEFLELVMDLIATTKFDFSLQYQLCTPDGNRILSANAVYVFAMAGGYIDWRTIIRSIPDARPETRIDVKNTWDMIIKCANHGIEIEHPLYVLSRDGYSRFHNKQNMAWLLFAMLGKKDIFKTSNEDAIHCFFVNVSVMATHVYCDITHVRVANYFTDKVSEWFDFIHYCSIRKWIDIYSVTGINLLS